jgi:hypothetical protein
MVYRYGAGGKQYEVSREQYFTLRNTPREQREQRLREWGIIPAAPPPTREDVIAQQQQKQQQALQTALRYNVSQQQRARVTGVGKVGRVYPGRVPGRVIVPEFELEGLMFGKRKFRPGAYRYFERNWPVATTPEEISMAFGFGIKKKKKR